MNEKKTNMTALTLRSLFTNRRLKEGKCTLQIGYWLSQAHDWLKLTSEMRNMYKTVRKATQWTNWAKDRQVFDIISDQENTVENLSEIQSYVHIIFKNEKSVTLSCFVADMSPWGLWDVAGDGLSRHIFFQKHGSVISSSSVFISVITQTFHCWICTQEKLSHMFELQYL